jgi:hypothetical protein
MSNKAKRHVHKYHRVDIGGAKLWACALGDCNHYMPAHMGSLVPGKNSICWKCNEQMVLNIMNMKDDKPKCDDCSGLNYLSDVINQIETKSNT